MNNFDINTFDELGRDHAIILLKEVYRTLERVNETSTVAAQEYSDDTRSQLAYEVGYLGGGIRQVLRDMSSFTMTTVNTLD